MWTFSADNLAILQRKSGLSAMLGKSLWPYIIAQFAARIVITMLKNLAILYGKSGLSAIADHPLSLYSVGQLLDIVPVFLDENYTMV